MSHFVATLIKALLVVVLAAFSFDVVNAGYTKKHGGCRKYDGGKGSDGNEYYDYDVKADECREKCERDPYCKAYEVKGSYKHCEIWKECPHTGSGSGDLDCYISDAHCGGGGGGGGGGGAGGGGGGGGYYKCDYCDYYPY